MKSQHRSQKPKKYRPILIAHRGGNAAGADKENTFVAFQSAIDLGFTYLETDAVLTADGQVIAFHGSPNFYKQITTGQLRRSRVQKTVYRDTKNITGVDVPLLHDLLDSFPDAFFSIDAKTDEVVEPLIKLIKSKKAATRVSLTSFSLRRSKKLVQASGGKSLVGYCVHPAKASWFKLGLTKNLKKLSVSRIGLLHFPYEQISERFITESHKKNIQVWAWTVNDEQSFQKMADLVVDGIITDETAKFKQA